MFLHDRRGTINSANKHKTNINKKSQQHYKYFTHGNKMKSASYTGGKWLNKNGL